MDSRPRAYVDDESRNIKRCPECGGAVASMSGCESCLACGLSRCPS